jgi:UDP-N-acetylglucosamine 4,6-dehydratase
LPQITNWSLDEFIKKFNAVKVKEGFNYNSENNTEWESVESLRVLIKENLYQDFSV